MDNLRDTEADRTDDTTGEIWGTIAEYAYIFEHH